ncbi:MAG TPA: hypothetical protein VFB28_11845 [Terriglobales bacterium]|nr:hypothetical protein [Terriglobales bacterium]
MPKFGSTDGSATLPQACYYTARNATPSPNGVKWNVSTTSGLTSALAGAACGDIIQITAGSTLSGNFYYSKRCDAQHYITIQTSGIASLPAEGTRIKPCYAGVASETGYPNFNCTSTKNVMAKLTAPNNISVLTINPGASYLRVIGIEFTRQTGTGINFSLVQSNGNQADHLIFDQVYMHGNQKTDETTRGLNATGMSYVAVVDSFFSDFWCISITGSCTDSQAIEANSGSVPMSALKIVNNFLAAAAENILLGGAGTGANQQKDVEIRSNWMYKPLTWYPSSSTYDGVSRVEKNHLEFKQCDRCLVEGNVMQNAWSGYSQVGTSFLLTPRESGVPPCCYDANITVRYNYVTHVCQVFQLGSDPVAQGQHDNTIHDIVADDLSYSMTGNYSCSLTYLTQLYSPPNQNGGQVPANTVMNNITISHLTIVSSLNAVQGLNTLDGPAPGSPKQVSNITFMNSLMDAGIYGFHTATGGSYSCTNGNGANNATLINGCWRPNSFDYHVLVRGGTAGGTWPGNHNFLPPNFSSVGFVKYNNGVGGDYRLCSGAGTPASSCASGSPYHNAANDGKDIGANVSLVNQYISAVNSF